MKKNIQFQSSPILFQSAPWLIEPTDMSLVVAVSHPDSTVWLDETNETIWLYREDSLSRLSAQYGHDDVAALVTKWHVEMGFALKPSPHDWDYDCGHEGDYSDLEGRWIDEEDRLTDDERTELWCYENDLWEDQYPEYPDDDGYEGYDDCYDLSLAFEGEDLAMMTSLYRL